MTDEALAGSDEAVARSKLADDATIDSMMELAASVARAAGTQAAAGWLDDIATGGRAALAATTKSSLTDVVTRHDKAAEQLIVATLVAARPDDAIVGEEGTDRPGTSGVRWYLDPIDGTTNFLYGFPLWCTSVAAADADGAFAGAVYVPRLDQLYLAGRGRGATCNGLPIAASGETELGLALLGTGFGYSVDERARQSARIGRIGPAVRDLRRTGSAAIDLVFTASGQLDAYFEEHLNWWDMAAGELIAREAGCRSGDFTGGPADPAQLLVTAPALFDTFCALLGDP